ncbi:hypothetical protein GCM10007905_00150 [Mixta theicola]|nr:hypothetical protein GCM10007905_00150 [Mixta theicola]
MKNYIRILVKKSRIFLSILYEVVKSTNRDKDKCAAESPALTAGCYD